jgi:DNA-binding response OmpR family regulator
LDCLTCENPTTEHWPLDSSLLELALPKWITLIHGIASLNTFPHLQFALRLIEIGCLGWRIGKAKLRVLIVEDEPRLAENIARSLRENAGYAVDIAPDGLEGLFLAESSDYDTVLLDLMLPKLDGLEVLKRLRKSGSHTPVLILTARDEKESVVTLLNAGADDYLTKPFDLGELLARTKALIRRGKGQPSPVLAIGDLELNTVSRSVQRGGKSVTLTAMEYRVLEYLAHRPGAVVSKTELLEHLYDYNWEKFSNVIEVYVSGLRRKLEGSRSRQLIQTIRGQGYILQE